MASFQNDSQPSYDKQTNISGLFSPQMFIQAIKILFTKTDSELKQTPLHYAFKNSNIELVLCIFGVIK